LWEEKKEKILKLDHKNSMFNISLSLGQKIMKSPPRNPPSQGFSKLAKNAPISIKKLVFIFFEFSLKRLFNFQLLDCITSLNNMNVPQSTPIHTLRDFQQYQSRVWWGMLQEVIFILFETMCKKKKGATC
jgi:hypothetical protein